MKNLKKIILCLTLIPVSLSAEWFASRKAHQAVQEKDYKHAIELLENKLVDSPQDGLLNYNLGTIYYKQKDFGAAQDYFTRAVANAASYGKEFEEKSNFNLGNSLYQKTVQQLGPNWERDKLDEKVAQEAIKQLQQAIAAYDNALKITADSNRTKTNKKAAEDLLNKLQKNQNQQQQNKQDQNKQDQDQQEQQDKQQQKDQQQKDQQDKQQQDQKKDEQQKQQDQKNQQQKQDQQQNQKQDQQQDKSQQNEQQKQQEQQKKEKEEQQNSEQQKKQEQENQQQAQQQPAGNQKQENMESRSVKVLLDKLQDEEKKLQKQLMLQKVKPEGEQQNKNQKPW